jgi:hypothetical protein
LRMRYWRGARCSTTAVGAQLLYDVGFLGEYRVDPEMNQSLHADAHAAGAVATRRG